MSFPRSLALAFEKALASVDLADRVHDALPAVPPVAGRVRVLAVGKAAPRMLAGALARWGPRIDRALVVVPDGTPVRFDERRVELLRAAHPLPDARSVVAGEQALGFARGGSGNDILLALVSGGASSLVCSSVGGGVILLW